MNYHHFQYTETRQLFEQNNLSEFEQLWTLDFEWFEEPNVRRNGWSGVIKYPLTDKQGNIIDVFIKRQENHNHKTLLHPIKGVPTFRREFFNIQRLNKNKIPTITALYYGERLINGNAQSILITRSLTGYQSFEDFFQPENDLPQELVSRVMQTAGQNVRLMHNAHFRHGALFPKHFFVKVDGDAVDVRVIDLEKLKWFPIKNRIRYNDLSRIIRRRPPATKSAFTLFIDSYLKYGHDLSQTRLAQKLYALLENTNH